LDYAVEAPDFDTMVEWVRSITDEIFLLQPQFWTVRARKGKGVFDYVLCRCDGQYGDGRRPNSVFVGTLFDDLARRDFTVNAIAFDEEKNEYIDPHNGVQDIKDKVLRCVGNAHNRFHEDALRMLRAIRFCVTKGFKMHRDVRELLHDRMLTDRLMMNVSEERKREELHKCFAHNTSLTLAYLSDFEMLRDACFYGDGKLWLMPTMREV